MKFQLLFFRSIHKINGISKKGETVFLTGYMERRKGNKQFVIREAEHVEELKKRTGNHRLFIKITVEKQAQERLVELDQILKKIYWKYTSDFIL